MELRDWLGRPVKAARSVGGVLAFRSAWDGVMRGDVTPWPPPELVQKIYQSRQARAYRGAELAMVTAEHDFYADLQSVHSEDAVTWSLFGPLAHAPSHVRAAYATQLIATTLEPVVGTEAAHIWLWRRLPHPDTLVPGGPEIDFGVQTERVLFLGEAKWRSSIGAARGADGSKDDGSKDQVQLAATRTTPDSGARRPTRRGSRGGPAGPDRDALGTPAAGGRAPSQQSAST